MNLEFSPEQVQLRDITRRLLDEQCTSQAVRAVLEGESTYDASLWQQLAELGLLGAAIPECYGGLGLGHLELCVLAEELGRVIAPVPFSSSIGLAAEFLLSAGREDQKARWLPAVARGETIGTFAWAEGVGTVDPKAFATRMQQGRLHGAKLPVPDALAAHIAIVGAEGEDGFPALFVVDLMQDAVTREPIDTLDPTRPQARVVFDGAVAESLGAGGDSLAVVRAVLDTAAVLVAFEQLGGADRALEMARDHALERMAFGRLIGSFQAIKHKLADMVVAVTLARSNAYYAAWALSARSPELAEAAAVARVGAIEAYRHCAREAIQVHGGMGFAWESDCHLHYRRAQFLALCLGSLPEWEDRLVECLRSARAA
jgi:alkylation response protein AidB-like acyl-CoA dehydrogenase